MAKSPFDGFAIGGLIPRAHDDELIISIVKKVRHEIGDRPLHVFGLGHPKWIPLLIRAGVDLVDSSSYVRHAVEGKSWWNSQVITSPQTFERVHLAIENLSFATWHCQQMPM